MAKTIKSSGVCSFWERDSDRILNFINDKKLSLLFFLRTFFNLLLAFFDWLFASLMFNEDDEEWGATISSSQPTENLNENDEEDSYEILCVAWNQIAQG